MKRLSGSLMNRSENVTSSYALTGIARTSPAIPFRRMGWMAAILGLMSGLLSGLMISLPAQAVDRCELDFAPTPTYKTYNKGARTEPEHDHRRQDRSLSEYNGLMTGLSSAKPLNLLTLVPVNGLAIDSGGGAGRAYHQMASAKGMRAVVVNAQDFRQATDLDPQDLFYGSKFEYRKGYSEEIIREFAGQASLITDVRGAFTDSPAKKELLETYYDALTDKGVALVLYSSQSSPVRVRVANGQTQDLARWLVENFPTVFSMDFSADRDHSRSIVLRMRRDPALMSLHLPLEIERIDTRDFSTRPLGEPTLVYTEVSE